MDLFKFTPVGYTTLTQGAQINGTKKVTWVERYSAPGEFTIEASLSSGLVGFLPLGTLISHTDTTEVMIVENHEIDESYSGDPTLKITGRSFVSFLENRIVGMNLGYADNQIVPYKLDANFSWSQIVKMINDHITYPPCDPDDALTNVYATHSLAGTGVSVERVIEFSPLWTEVDKLLKIDELGIRTIRRNTFGAMEGSPVQTVINVYKGVDKTPTVMFSWVSGDIEEAKYLFSQKDTYTSALVVGQYIHVVVDGTETNYQKRTMVVDGKDIDGHLGQMPTGQTLTDVTNAMIVRGEQALAAQIQTSISQVDLSPNANYKFRKDYNLGDLVAIDGNFGQMTVMRITEHAEIEDETSAVSTPKLSFL